MNPQTLAKIRALAEDERGDPRIRAIAQARLKEYAPSEPPPGPKSSSYYNKPHPGTIPTPEYVRARFMDLNSWGKTKSGGNPICTSAINGKIYSVILFRYKQTPTWGWRRIDTETDEKVFSDVKYPTLIEAHQGAWEALMHL